MKIKKTIALVGTGAVLVPLSLAAKVQPPKTPTLRDRMLAHVERVLILDTLTVDREKFMRSYRLEPSAGRLLSGSETVRELASGQRGFSFPDNFDGEPLTGFTNEFNDYLIWAQPDTTGYLRLAESVRLADGTWSQPQFASPILNSGREEEDEEDAVVANAAYPFMLDDGQTLYFAADNSQSLGGYDIFIATKDPSDGEYLIPGNIGMPFNSEYDDYMLAIDRQTGVGWWASDRNQLEDEVTVYIYALTDERVNVEPDDENLSSYASLSGWESLLDDDQQAERERLKKAIANIRPVEKREPEFELPMPGGLTYRFYTDFKNPKAATRMEGYMKQRAGLEQKMVQLAGLRARYAEGDKAIAQKIQSLEEQVRREEATLKSQLSEIYRLENPKN